jgi:hypothetical protein
LKSFLCIYKNRKNYASIIWVLPRVEEFASQTTSSVIVIVISVEVGLDFRVRVRVRVRLRIRLRDRDWLYLTPQTTQLADHMISSPLPEELPNNLIELKFNPVYTINIIIIYRGKIAKHDSVHINFCRLPRNSAIF